MKDFKGKLVYITGGSSGIGLSLARLLCARGARILLCARNQKKLLAAKREIEKSAGPAGGAVMTLSVDVSNPRDVSAKMKRAVKEFGAPDILVNSAGINTHADRFENMSLEDLDEVMKTNVYGTWNATRALIGPMREKKGHVVIMASAAGLFGMFGYTVYATTKAALIGFADSLRYELAPLGMKLTLVCPPEVDTPMNIDEAKTLPPEGRAVKDMGGFITPDFAAGEIMRAIEKGSYLVIPCLTTRFLYLMHRLTNGRLTRLVTDMVIRGVRKKKGMH